METKGIYFVCILLLNVNYGYKKITYTYFLYYGNTLILLLTVHKVKLEAIKPLEMEFET